MTADATWTNAGSSALAGTLRAAGTPSRACSAALRGDRAAPSASTCCRCLADDARAVAIYDATSTVAGQTRTRRFVPRAGARTPEAWRPRRTTLAYDQAAADAHLAGVPSQS